MGRKNTRRHRLQLGGAVVLFACAVNLLLPSVARSQQSSAPKGILVIYWYNKDFPSNAAFDQSFQASLQSAPPGSVDYYAEFLETDRFPGEDQAIILRDYLRRKYADRNIRAIVAPADPTLEFCMRYRADLFPGVPIVFGAAKSPSEKELTQGAGMTGIVYHQTYRENLDLLLKLHPNTRHVFVVSGSLDHDKRYETPAREDLRGYEHRVSIEYVTGLSPDELTSKMKNLPERSVILYVWQQAYDRGGKILESHQVLRLITDSTTAPIYGQASWHVGSGAVGGFVRSAESGARKAAAIALRIANGERAQDIPVEKTPVEPTFDWRQLQRWGISEASLPAGSIVRFKEVTYWEQNKWRIIGVLTLMAVQTLFIAALLIERRRRRESEVNHRSIFNSVNDAIFVYDIESGRIVDVNRVMCEMFGWTEAEVKRLGAADLSENEPPYTGRDAFRWLRKAIEGDAQVFEWRARRKTGELFWIEVSLRRAVIGGKDRLIAVVRDISERKQSEAALDESEERKRDILRALPDLMFLQTPDGVYLDYHANSKKDLYVEPEGFMGKNVCDVLPPEFSRPFLPLLKRAHENGELQVMEYVLPMHGEEMWFEARIVNSGDNVLSVVRNITDRKRAEAALREHRMKLAGIIDSAMDAIISVDEDQRVVLVNLAAEQMFGCAASEAMWRPIESFIPGIQLQRLEGDVDEIGILHSSNRSLGMIGDLYGQRADGTHFPIEASISQVELDSRKFYTVILRDITSRRQSEEALRESEERFRNVADTAPIMIWVTGVDKLCTYANQQWLDFTGRKLEQDLGYGWAASIHPDDVDRCFETYNIAFGNREPFTIEYRLRRVDGEFRWVFVSGAPRLSPNGEFLGYIGSCLDITERKVGEQALADLSGQLIRAREDECARIARELHDDVNQRMALVAVELEQLRQNPPKTADKLRAELQDLIDQAVDISSDIHRMSYDLHPSKLVHLGLVATVNSLCEEVRKKHGLRIEFTHEDVPATLSKDVSLCLYRIAQECMNNVIKHSGAERAWVDLRGTGGEVHLRVSDSGRGLDPASTSQSKGLGLLGMRERLRLVGGTISIRSNSTGTQVDARVPIQVPALTNEAIPARALSVGND